MIWAWRPCWSSDAEHLNNFSCLKALQAVYEISLVAEEKSFEIVDSRRMTYDGACLYYMLPRSLRLR